jgi:hypothetical protein
MSRKQRSDSISTAIQVAQKNQDLTPPSSVPLEPEDMGFWNNIIQLRPKVQWNEHDLEFAAFLARAMGQLEIEQRRFRKEGSLIKTASGNPMVNPRASVVHGLHAQVKGYRQSLGLHDRGQNGEPRDAEKKRTEFFNIERGLNSGDNEHGLLN